MRQIGTQSSKCFRKIVTFVLAFAMIITSLAVSSTESQAATKKVKKVTIGVKVGGSGILVLKKGQTKKLKVTVSPKKASKKVTYKSSKKSVVSVSSKGVVKARKSKGSAKITVTSKQNAKKKATIKVKIGTPIKKVSIQNKAVVSWTSANWVLKEVNGQKKKIWPSYKQTVTAKKSTYEVMKGRTITLKTSTSPKKATYKKYYWKSNKTSVATIPAANKVGSSTKVSTKKEGTATIIAKAMDGSGKTAKVKIKVVKFITDKTPAPTATPDSRITTMIENFESYNPGTTWDKFTAANKLNADGSSTSGTMTVVTDPENAENKCLQIKYTGPDAYDFAPVFSVDIDKLKDSLGNPSAGKKLSSYTGVKLSARVVGTSGDVTYKKIYCYFDQDGKISKTDKFAADGNKSNSAHVDNSGNPVAAGAANEDRSLRFGVEIPMAEGSDKENGTVLFNGNSTKESDKFFPFYYGSWTPEDASTHYATNSCTTGFKAKEEDGKVGFAGRSLSFNTTRINEADSTLLNQSKFDMVLGSTYGGSTKNTGGTDLTLYIDDVALVEDQVEIQDFALSLPEGGDVVYPGGDVKVNVTYTPVDTTQKDLTWTTNNDKVSVDTEGKVTVAEDFELANNETTEVVVTATSKAKPSLTKSVTFKVCPIQLPTEPYVVDFEATYDAELSGDLKPEKTTDENGVECWKFTFTGKNQRVYFKLPEEVNLSGYQKYELKGYSQMQIILDIFDASLPEAQKKTEADSSYEWWNTRTVTTLPFYGGSHSQRPATDIPYLPEYDSDPSYAQYKESGIIPKGSAVGPNDIETVSRLLSTDKSTDSMAGNYNKAKYIAIGNATDNSPEDGGTPFYIYDLRFTPKPTGELDKLPTVDLSSGSFAESMEGDSVALQWIENSTVVEATADLAANDGTHYLDVHADDQPGILIDNSEGTEDAKYSISAWVKAKDAATAGTVTFISGENFKDAKYEQYEGYDKVQKLAGNKPKSVNLSTADGWVEITAKLTVAAGKISEVNVGSTGAGFEFLLDNVTLQPR